MKVLILTLGVILLASSPSVFLGQTHGPMGFDQGATTHHFYLYESGGAIEVSVHDPDDATSLSTVRRHLKKLPLEFGVGDFSTPRAVHQHVLVTGADALERLASRIEYKYRDIEPGGRVEIITADGEALAAVHTFLRFQISNHQTGDALEVTMTP